MHKLNRKLKRVLIGAVVTASALTLGATPAYAGSNAHGYSWWESCGVLGCVERRSAEAWFYHNGDDWKVCDLAADGDRAMVSIYWSDSGGNHYHRLAATGGAHTCASGGEGVNIPEGKKVTMIVWHQDGANGSPQHERRYTGTA